MTQRSKFIGPRAGAQPQAPPLSRCVKVSDTAGRPLCQFSKKVVCVKFSKKRSSLVSRPPPMSTFRTRRGPSVSNSPKRGRHSCQILLGRPAARVKVPAAPGALCQILPPCVKVSNFSRPRGPYYPRIDILDHVARTTHRQRLKSLNQSPSYALRQDGSVVSRDKRV